MTHVIILCQGSQSRLPDLATPKQLLPLRGCAGAPILFRTVRQVSGMDLVSVTIVGRQVSFADYVVNRMAETSVVELAEPGNSSLKGLFAFLGQVAASGSRGETIVLLGDCCYSWACLDRIFTPGIAPISFVCSSDLTASTGEVWGVRWSAGYTPLYSLRRALERHPPFKEYQPGQLRRWLWECTALGHADTFRCDDYTRDFDKPEDLKLLDATSESAKADDLAHGVTWP